MSGIYPEFVVHLYRLCTSILSIDSKSKTKTVCIVGIIIMHLAEVHSWEIGDGGGDIIIIQLAGQDYREKKGLPLFRRVKDDCNKT